MFIFEIISGEADGFQNDKWVVMLKDYKN